MYYFSTLLDIYFEPNDQPLNNGEFVPISMTQYHPTVEWIPQKGSYYTLIMYDLDAPYPDQPNESPFLHWLITDIFEADLSTGYEKTTYMPPNPPTDSEPHTYVIAVYKQPRRGFTRRFYTRERFPLDDIVNENKLELITSLEFQTGHNYQGWGYDGIIPTSTYSRYSERFIENPNISIDEQKWCQCYIKKATTNPSWCNREKAWFQRRGKGSLTETTCYNPYSVCARSVGTTSQYCDENFNFEAFTDDELRAYAELHNLPIPRDRQELLNTIYNFLEKY